VARRGGGDGGGLRDAIGAGGWRLEEEERRWARVAGWLAITAAAAVAALDLAHSRRCLLSACSADATTPDQKKAFPSLFFSFWVPSLNFQRALSLVDGWVGPGPVRDGHVWDLLWIQAGPSMDCITRTCSFFLSLKYVYTGNSGIATMVGVHMHSTVGSGICNTLVSDYNTPASNAVT
jgi:hypothetical protein